MKISFAHLPGEDTEKGIAALRAAYGPLKIKRPKVEKNPPYQHVYIRTREPESDTRRSDDLA